MLKSRTSKNTSKKVSSSEGCSEGKTEVERNIELPLSSIDTNQGSDNVNGIIMPHAVNQTTDVINQAADGKHEPPHSSPPTLIELWAESVATDIAESSESTKKITVGKRKRIDLTLQQKLDVLTKIEAGATRAEIKLEYGIEKQTISDMLRMKKEIRQSAFHLCANSVGEKSKSTKRVRFIDLSIKAIEEDLLAWIGELNAGKSLSLNSNLTREKLQKRAREKALSVCTEIEAKGDKIADSERDLLDQCRDFTASAAWLNSFLKNNRISNMFLKSLEEKEEAVTPEADNSLKSNDLLSSESGFSSIPAMATSLNSPKKLVLELGIGLEMMSSKSTDKTHGEAQSKLALRGSLSQSIFSFNSNHNIFNNSNSNSNSKCDRDNSSMSNEINTSANSTTIMHVASNTSMAYGKENSSHLASPHFNNHSGKHTLISTLEPACQMGFPVDAMQVVSIPSLSNIQIPYPSGNMQQLMQLHQHVQAYNNNQDPIVFSNLDGFLLD